MGFVAPHHVGSSQTRAWIRVPCISRCILNHCATREALHSSLYLLVPIPNLSLSSTLSPLVTTSLFSTSVNLVLFYIYIHLYYFLHSTYKLHHIVFVFVWHPLSILFSRSINIAANGRILFFFCGWVIFHCISIPHLFNSIIHWWALGLLPCLGYCK